MFEYSTMVLRRRLQRFGVVTGSLRVEAKRDRSYMDVRPAEGMKVRHFKVHHHLLCLSSG